MALEAISLLRELVALPGAPGAEDQVRTTLQSYLNEMEIPSSVDARGNLLACVGPLGTECQAARIVVTAHMDELALMVSQVEHTGAIHVSPMGGLPAWKWGEQPVEIWSETGPILGAISFGSIHTESKYSAAHALREEPISWEICRVLTGCSATELAQRGVRPGCRVTLARSRRALESMDDLVAGYFLDDRADLVAWLLTLEQLRNAVLGEPVLFAATASEETGGEGALFLLHGRRAEVCIALEIGPSVPESPFWPDARPTIWVNDGFSAMTAADGDLLAEICRGLGYEPHWQALSRGGSDASCAAAVGLCARPITLGLAVESSHGFEIMHRDAPERLAELLIALLSRLARADALLA